MTRETFAVKNCKSVFDMHESEKYELKQEMILND